MTREGAAEAAGHDGERRKKENRRQVPGENDGEGKKGRGGKERNLMEYSENGTWRLKGFLRAIANELQIYSEIDSILKYG